MLVFSICSSYALLALQVRLMRGALEFHHLILF